MTKRTADRKAQGPVTADAVRIGKDVVELVTSGMYVSPVTIYREYVQNSADAIDAARASGVIAKSARGQASISFDHEARSVVIRDNGIGVPARDVASVLLAVGGSLKRSQAARGFRGVGRLSGLAYCRELEFRTKVAGQASVVSLVWDCRRLRQRIADSMFSGDVREIISDCVAISHENAADPADHFMEVRLREIARLRGDVLLNEAAVSHYLSQVAPVPFAPTFSHAAEIQKRLPCLSASPPIELTVAGTKVFRPFEDIMELPGTKKQVSIEALSSSNFPTWTVIMQPRDGSPITST